MKKRSLDDKRAKLLDAASRMLERDGFQQFKVAELAREASVSISTIYTFFGSKEGIYLAYIGARADELFAALDGFRSEDPLERLKHYVAIVSDMAEQGRFVLEEGVRDNPLFFNTTTNEFPDRARQLYGFLAARFREINPELGEEEALKLGYGFNGHLHGYIQHWVGAGGVLRDLTEGLCETFVCLAMHCYGDRRGPKQTKREAGK